MYSRASRETSSAVSLKAGIGTCTSALRPQHLKASDKHTDTVEFPFLSFSEH